MNDNPYESPREQGAGSASSTLESFAFVLMVIGELALVFFAVIDGLLFDVPWYCFPMLGIGSVGAMFVFCVSGELETKEKNS